MPKSTQPETPSTPNPETFRSSRNRVEKAVRFALKEAGIDIPSIALVEELTNLVIDERSDARDGAAHLLEVVLERGLEDTFTPEQLEQLAYAIRFTYLDEDGNRQMAFPDTDPESV